MDLSSENTFTKQVLTNVSSKSFPKLILERHKIKVKSCLLQTVNHIFVYSNLAVGVPVVLLRTLYLVFRSEALKQTASYMWN